MAEIPKSHSVVKAPEAGISEKAAQACVQEAYNQYTKEVYANNTRFYQYDAEHATDPAQVEQAKRTLEAASHVMETRLNPAVEIGRKGAAVTVNIMPNSGAGADNSWSSGGMMDHREGIINRFEFDITPTSVTGNVAKTTMVGKALADDKAMEPIPQMTGDAAGFDGRPFSMKEQGDQLVPNVAKCVLPPAPKGQGR